MMWQPILLSFCFVQWTQIPSFTKERLQISSYRGTTVAHTVHIHVQYVWPWWYCRSMHDSKWASHMYHVGHSKSNQCNYWHLSFDFLQYIVVLVDLCKNTKCLTPKLNQLLEQWAGVVWFLVLHSMELSLL